MSPDLTENAIADAGLAKLAEAINRAHRGVIAAAMVGLAHARRAGEHLLEARALVPHGQWETWVAANCEAQLRTCQQYMQVARGWNQLEAKSATRFALRAALRVLAESARNRRVGSGALADRWGQPPFSVLLPDSPKWQERRREWLALGIEPELPSGPVGSSASGRQLTLEFQRRISAPSRCPNCGYLDERKV